MLLELKAKEIVQRNPQLLKRAVNNRQQHQKGENMNIVA
jgi:hypothetical protein